jgi:serine/threonine protein kinase/tetratricopeptide (TPR) repeat protein
MDPNRWQRVNDLFHAVLALEPRERHAFLANASDGDAALVNEIERLVLAHERATQFLGTSSAASAANTWPIDDAPLQNQCGPYRIVRQLGRGGMGAVYLAERSDAQFQKRVALKLIKRGMDTDAMLARFRDERQILANLDHPNIARLLDGGTSPDERPYLVMELVEGKPIDVYCDERRLSIADRLALFLRACAAVSYAHQHLVVHRDIKPSNILVSADGTPKLLDFGIAKIVHEDGAGTTATMAELRRLTPEYASPEQIAGSRMTTSTDVYSLGVVLYELLSGRPPYRFSHASPELILRAIADTRSVAPSIAACSPDSEEVSGSVERRAAARAESSPERLRRRLRGDLDTIVLKALRTEPERRYLSVDLFAEDIRRHLEGRPVLARPDTVAYRTGKFVRRNKGVVAAGVLVCLTLVAGVIATGWQARRAREQEQIAKAEQARAQRRFDDVRKLARSVMFDYHDAIKDLPGATPVRARLVRDALEYLDALAKDAGTDAALRNELAAAYERVGEVQGGTQFANLGDTPGAIDSFRKALVLREAARAAHPQDRSARHDLAVIHRRLGMLLWETGDIKGALENSRRALTVLHDLAATESDNAVNFDLAKASDTVGMVLQETGDAAGALDHYRQSQQIYDRIMTADVENKDARRGLSVAYEHMGTLHLQTGDLDNALASNTRALTLREKLVADVPVNADYRRILLVSYYNQGEILSAMGRSRDALQSYRQNQSAAEQLLVSDPNNEQYRGDLAYALIRVGDMLAVGRSYAQALDNYRRSQALRERDVKADPGNLWKRASLIEAHAKITKTLAKAGQYDAAAAAHGQTLELVEHTTIAPTNVAFRSFFATTYSDLGETHVLIAADPRIPIERRGPAWRTARTMYQRSLDIWNDLNGRGIMNAVDGPKLAAVTREIARCEQMLGRNH